ncbi:MAG: glycosyltransferase family 39 protein [Rhodobacteraceae bacterium]|nr:glycosyltransferase family 39 protein [Paracoccaceae bacterium]
MNKPTSQGHVPEKLPTPPGADQSKLTRLGGGPLAVLAGTLILGLWTLWEPFSRDQGIHAAIALGLTEGLMPYRDIYNIKPPMTTMMHALSQILFGPNPMAIRALDLIVFALTALGLHRVTLKLGGSGIAAVLAGLMLGVLYYMMTYWEHAQTDGWAGFLLVGVVLTLLRGWETGKTRWFALAGALLAMGFAFKYTVAGAGLLIFAPLAAPLGRGFRWRDFGAFVAGGLAFLAVVTLWLGLTGALGPYLDIQRFVLGYVGIDLVGDDSQIIRVFKIFSRDRTAAWLLVLGLVGLLLALRGLPRYAPAITGIWLGAGLLSGFAQGKGFSYHFLPALPPLALLAGLGLSHLAQWASRNLSMIQRKSAAAMAVLAVSLMLPMPQRSVDSIIAQAQSVSLTPIWATDFVTPDYNAIAIRSVSARLDQIRAEDETFFLWGYATGLYLLQNQPPLHRFPYSWPFSVPHHDGRYTPDLLARLQTAPPDLFLVEFRDATEWATGHNRDSRAVLEDYPEIQTFLTTGYRLEETMPRFEIWRRLP